VHNDAGRELRPQTIVDQRVALENEAGFGERYANSPRREAAHFDARRGSQLTGK
jgi:hypothetical protein